MTLSAGLAPLLAALLMVSSVADAEFPAGGGHYGARLTPRSYSVHNSYSAPHNSYSAPPYASHYGDVAESYHNTGNSHNNIGNRHNNIGGSYNNGGNYNNIGNNYNSGASYHNIDSSHAGDHSVYMRNNGHVSQNGYSVNTASSALRAESVQVVRPDGYGHYQDNRVGDYDGGARSQYRYEVSDPRTGDAKSQQETRHGDTVTGEYRVLEANGLMRIVSYTADDAHGFVAQVRWVPGERPHGAAVSHQEVTQQQSH